MIRRKAYKYRLKTKPDIENLLFQYCGCNRYVWNKALALQIKSLKNDHKVISYTDMAAFLVQWKHEDEFSFLQIPPSQSLQQTLKNLDRALHDAFDKKQPNKKFPIFKKRGLGDSYRYPQGFKIEGNRIFLPKIGYIGFYKSRKIEGIPKNVTISRRGKHWFISIQCEQELFCPERTITNPVGIDLGCKKFITTSTGSFLHPVNSFKKLQSKLAIAQKNLARKVKFSKNWLKQKQIITRIHMKIADIRTDFLQKQSTILSKNHAMIIAEDLNIKKMSESAKGTIIDPGRNVKVKADLNKSILDQGWSMFLKMLAYKQAWSGGVFLKVNPVNTSRTCPECGFVSANNRKTQSRFKCIKCGCTGNADYIAAINIRLKGLKEYFGGGAHRNSLWRDDNSRSLKQELEGMSNLLPLPCT